MVHIFATEIASRVEYTFQLIFETILNDEVTFHTSEESFQNIDGAKINYSNNDQLSGLQLRPVFLLFESHLIQQDPEIVEWEGVKGLFAVENSTIPFDLFAASFYLVSRYEEYLPSELDQHQRYRANESITAKNLFLNQPIVNYWALKLADLIERQYPEQKFNRPKFKYCPSIDIDNAYAYKHKGFARMLGSFLKDFLNGRWQLLKKRFAVVFRSAKDPYDNYEYLSDVLANYQFEATYFILLNSSGGKDKSLSHRNISYRSLISTLAKSGEVGIHPSYASNKSTNQLNKEIQRLRSITDGKVVRSRQHYLKLTFPETYRNLILQGIKADYSMGYPDRTGFRAGVATPFLFFDILENNVTSLMIHPFQVMDVTLKQYQNKKPDEALKKIEELLSETAKVGGTFVSLWHNESLGDEGRWKGWQHVYTEMTRLAFELTNEQRN